VIAVADAGLQIHLSWIGRLDVLPVLYDPVLVPPTVEHEVLRARPEVPGVEAIRVAFGVGWLRLQAVTDLPAVTGLQRAAGLDRGESEAIVLFREAAAHLLLIDERRARAYAEREGLPVTGTVGILRRARERGLVPAVAPLLDELRAQGFRITARLVELVRQEEAS
jgi:predicted nucleic acid-binding protein